MACHTQENELTPQKASRRNELTPQKASRRSSFDPFDQLELTMQEGEGLRATIERHVTPPSPRTPQRRGKDAVNSVRAQPTWRGAAEEMQEQPEEREGKGHRYIYI